MLTRERNIKQHEIRFKLIEHKTRFFSGGADHGFMADHSHHGIKEAACILIVINNKNMRHFKRPRKPTANYLFDGLLIL